MKSALDFNIFHPEGRLSGYVQGIWSASTSHRGPEKVRRWLQGDGGSGVMFNFGKAIYIDDTRYACGVIFLPVSKRAHAVTIPAGSELAGVRFCPAVGFGVFGERFEKPTEYKGGLSGLGIQDAYACLSTIPGHQARIVALYRWLLQSLDFSNVVPTVLSQALKMLEHGQLVGEVVEGLPLSQRQLERQLKKVTGVSLKHFQRIMRVKKALTMIKQRPEVDFVEVAQVCGFADQSHMTRELSMIAYITPLRYRKILLARQCRDSQIRCQVL